MTCHRHRTRRPSLLAGLVFVLAIGLALPAAAAQLLKVRVGSHPGFTRVVFELDGAAGYRVEQVGSDAAPVLRVSLDAASRSYDLRRVGDVADVKVAAGKRAVATIALAKSGLRMREMILSNPDRIVLDLYKPESALAKTATPVTKPIPATPKPAPKVVAKAPPAPKPAPVTKPAPAPKPAPIAKPEPAPKPAPIAKPEPAPKPAPIAKPEPAPKPAPIAKTPPAPKPAIIAKTAPAPKPVPSGHPPISPTPPAKTQPEPRVLPPAPKINKPGKTAKATPPATPKATPNSTGAPSWSDRLSGDPMWQGGIAAALIGVVALVFAVRHRRRSLPNDLDVTAIAEEIEGAGRNPSEGFEMDDAPGAMDDATETASAPIRTPAPPAPIAASAPAPKRSDADTSIDGLFDAPATKETPKPAAAAMPVPPAPMTQEPEIAEAAAAEDEVAPDSLFGDTGGVVGDDPSEGDAPMNQDMDLPADPSMTPPPSVSPSVMGGAAAMPDVSRMLEEFERRIQTLEGKLDESNEAREKLERQVAAQSEELRVQRAAIARTQRALRTMSRADEDKATEPAMREGDTQAKTRVNV